MRDDGVVIWNVTPINNSMVAVRHTYEDEFIDISPITIIV